MLVGVSLRRLMAAASGEQQGDSKRGAVLVAAGGSLVWRNSTETDFQTRALRAQLASPGQSELAVFSADELSPASENPMVKLFVKSLSTAGASPAAVLPGGERISRDESFTGLVKPSYNAKT